MKSPVSVLDPLFEEPKDGAEVTGAMVTLTPADAEAVIRTMCFERQRDADRAHIGMLADMFANGEFAPGSQLTFAINGGNIPLLVDGQHRLRAAVKAKWQGVWHVRVLWSEVHRAAPVYALLDSHQKKRPASVVGRALGMDALSDRMQASMMSACRYQLEWSRDYTLPANCKVPPVRDCITQVKELLPQFEAADSIFNAINVSSQAKRKLMSGKVMAVVVETIASTLGEEAHDFWSNVATNGPGVAGELRDRLLVGPPPKSTQFYNPRLVAQGWNHRAKPSLPKHRHKNTVLAVDGTSLILPA